MGSTSGSVFYCKEVPLFELKEGMVHVCHKVGDHVEEFVMRPNLFLKALKRANQVADEFAEHRPVVPLKKDGRH